MPGEPASAGKIAASLSGFSSGADAPAGATGSPGFYWPVEVQGCEFTGNPFTCPYPISWVAPGETADYSFTTKPRAILTCDECGEADNDEAMYNTGLPRRKGFELAQRARPGWPIAELARSSAMTSDGGLGVGIGSLAALLPRVAAAGRLALDPGSPGSCTTTWLDGTLAVPGPQVQLKSFKWDLVGGDQDHALQTLYETHLDDWTKDKMEPEGATLVDEPGWIIEDSGKVRSDPVSYSSGTTPALRALKLTIDDPEPWDAIVRIESDQTALKFPDTTVHFKNGKAQYAAAIPSQQAFPGAVDNIAANLTWSVSVDDGQTFTPFAWTKHNVFITLGRAMGFDGFAGIKAAPNITAARLNTATEASKRKTTPEGVVGSATKYVRSQIRHVIDKNIGDLDMGGNPWRELDKPPSGLDCISVTSVALVVILQGGVDAGEYLAWPTVNGDASEQQKSTVLYQPATLEYYVLNGVNLNWFEAFLFMREDGTPTKAYTVGPILGPIRPQGAGTVRGLPSDPVKQLAFRVMYRALLYEYRHRTQPDNRAGQQWWIQDDNGAAVLQALFPLPIQ